MDNRRKLSSIHDYAQPAPSLPPPVVGRAHSLFYPTFPLPPMDSTDGDDNHSIIALPTRPGPAAAAAATAAAVTRYRPANLHHCTRPKNPRWLRHPQARCPKTVHELAWRFKGRPLYRRRPAVAGIARVDWSDAQRATSVVTV